MIRLLFPGEDLDVQLERIAEFGRTVVPDLRRAVPQWAPGEAPE